MPLSHGAPSSSRLAQAPCTQLSGDSHSTGLSHALPAPIGSTQMDRAPPVQAPPSPGHCVVVHSSPFTQSKGVSQGWPTDGATWQVPQKLPAGTLQKAD
jgi:hypothetical protein